MKTTECIQINLKDLLLVWRESEQKMLKILQFFIRIVVILRDFGD